MMDADAMRAEARLLVESYIALSEAEGTAMSTTDFAEYVKAVALWS